MTVAVLGGCGASPSPSPLPAAPQQTDSGGPTVLAPEAAAEPAKAPPESERDRRVRVAQDKLTACQILAQVIERAQKHDTIIYAGDPDTLRQLAKKLAERGRDVVAIDLSADEQGPLRAARDQYAAATRDMAQTLNKAAAASSSRERQGALDEFNRIEQGLGAIVQQMVDRCNEPVP